MAETQPGSSEELVAQPLEFAPKSRSRPCTTSAKVLTKSLSSSPTFVFLARWMVSDRRVRFTRTGRGLARRSFMAPVETGSLMGYRGPVGWVSAPRPSMAFGLKRSSLSDPLL